MCYAIYGNAIYMVMFVPIQSGVEEGSQHRGLIS